jgi:D-alanine-D-alanine ligase
LWTGEGCATALEDAGYQVTRVDAGRDLAQRLTELKPDACFNALHGRWGEDGAVQGLLEVLGIPYTHSGVLASSLAMHKERAKAVMKAAGVPVADGRMLTREEALARHAIEPPYVAKPISEGSSVGVVIVHVGANRPPEAIAKIPALDGQIMVEQFVAGKELTCGFSDGRATEIIDIQPAANLAFYDFEAKYAPGGSVHILPAQIPADVTKAIQAHTLAAHHALGCRGVSRADFRYDPATGQLICMEVNTQPGMTGPSLIPELAANRGITYAQLCALLVEDASVDR